MARIGPIGKPHREQGRRHVEKISFEREEKRALVRKVQAYFATELDVEIGDIGTELLLDFLQEEIGAFYYNKGLHDAQIAFRQQVESFDDAIYALEKPEALRG